MNSSPKALCGLFGWFDWEDNSTSVHSLNCIETPRIPYEDFKEGDDIVAYFGPKFGCGRSKTGWHGTIVAISDSKKELLKKMKESLLEDSVPVDLIMKSEVVKGLQRIGYNDTIIRKAAVKFSAENGNLAVSEDALLQMIYSLEEKNANKENRTPPKAKRKRHSEPSPGGKNRPAKVSRIQIEADVHTGQIEDKNCQKPAVVSLVGDLSTALSKTGKGHTQVLVNVEELKSIIEENCCLKKENTEWKEQSKCKICMDELVCTSFLPCGHLCACSTCAPTMKQCPFCRLTITGSVKTFLV